MGIGAVLNQHTDQFNIAVLRGNPERTAGTLQVHKLRRMLENLNGILRLTSLNGSDKPIH